MKSLNIKAIRIDGGTQSRAEINNEAVAEYAEAIKAGATFPPVVVFHDGADYWLADGFHRYHACAKAGKVSIEADICTGTLRDAILYSLGVNDDHGLRRTNADKRKGVQIALGDSEWSKWSQEKIAKACKVSAGFVSKMVHEAASLHGEEIKPKTRTVERNGKTYEQDTSNIGNNKPAAPAKPAAKPEESPQYDGPDAAELAANEAATKADMLALQKLLDSDDKLATAHSEIKRLNAELAVVKLARDGYMNKCNEQIKMIKSLQRKLDKVAA